MKKRKTIRTIRPNPGVEAAYRRSMDRMISEMARSLEYWISAAYRRDPPRMAEDATPAIEMQRELTKLGKRWIKRFDEMARSVAERFAQGVLRSYDSAFQSALADAGWTVKFTMTPVVKDALDAKIEENIALIKSLPQQHLQEVQGIVMRGFSAGRDLGEIVTQLQKRTGVTRRRAKLIAGDQANKATAVVEQARRMELGIEEAEWIHSGAGKEPRPSHVAAGRERRRFKIAKGCLIDGEYIQPGEKINCRCGSRAVLPF